MRYPRFRLKSMMILVLFAAVLLGAGVHLARLEPPEQGFLDERIVLIGLFLILVVAKLILLATALARRGRQPEPPKTDQFA